MEDGLDLWLAVLENSFTVTPELFSLCDNILPIIGKLITSVITDHSDPRMVRTCWNRINENFQISS